MKRAIKNRKHHTEMQRQLAETAKLVLDRGDCEEPHFSERQEERLVGMAMWTAAMRGAVSRDKYTHELQLIPTAEVGTRLVGQFHLLAAGVAIFRGRKRVGASEMAVVARVARDSAPDINEEIVRQLYVQSRDDYVDANQVKEWTRIPWDVVSNRLRDMEMLGVTQKATGKGAGPGYRLSRAMVRLMSGLDLYAGEKTWRRR